MVIPWENGEGIPCRTHDGFPILHGRGKHWNHDVEKTKADVVIPYENGDKDPFQNHDGFPILHGRGRDHRIGELRRGGALAHRGGWPNPDPLPLLLGSGQQFR